MSERVDRANAAVARAELRRGDVMRDILELRDIIKAQEAELQSLANKLRRLTEQAQ